MYMHACVYMSRIYEEQIINETTNERRKRERSICTTTLNGFWLPAVAAHSSASAWGLACANSRGKIMSKSRGLRRARPPGAVLALLFAKTLEADQCPSIERNRVVRLR